MRESKDSSEPGNTNGDPHYALGKLGQAVYVLATGEGTIRARVWDAYMVFAPIMERDLPADLREDLRWIRAELTKRPAGIMDVLADGHISQVSTGRLGATVPRMRIAKLVAVAKRIYILEDELRRRLQNQS